MRKRLGSLEKAPIEKNEQSFTRKSLALLSCCVALIITHFGVNFGVDLLNFLEKNTGGNNYIIHGNEIVWYTKGVLATVAVVFILNRQS